MGFRVLRGCISGLLALHLIVPAVRGCTIFVLTDGHETLFFNNEDWSNPVSRVWFVPAPEGFHSCVYVGFDNNGSEGGMNSAGLAFDWVAGFTETWTPYASILPVGGRTSERMLESCATVEDAIEFYTKYREPQFSRAKILVADKSGASAIIGAHDGKLQIDRANHSRGFGYGEKTLATMLQINTPAKMETGRTILQACEQKGQFATKYSTVFDLNKGEVALFAAGNEDVRLNLADELKRGAHYYDIPKLREQLTQPPNPALSNMRSFLREFQPINDKHPELTERVLALVRALSTGKIQKAAFTPELWKDLAPMKKTIRQDLAPFGKFLNAIEVESVEETAPSKHRYRLEFQKASVVQDFIFENGKLASIKTIGVEWKHPLPIRP